MLGLLILAAIYTGSAWAGVWLLKSIDARRDRGKDY